MAKCSRFESVLKPVNALLVRVTREIEGVLAGHQAVNLVESQFIAEVGELPQTLAQLKQEIRLPIN